MQETIIKTADSIYQNDINPENLDKLQDLLQIGLSWFLNGEKITPLSRLLYPFVDKPIATEWQNWIAEGKRAFQALQINSAPNAPEITSLLDIAKILADGYRYLFQNYKIQSAVLSTSKSKQIQIQLFDERLYRLHQPYLSPVLNLWVYANRYLAEFTYGIYLHGSMSTLDYVVGSSDIDALVIVDRLTLTDPERLLALRRRLVHTLRWFYAVDPFQHHGYFVLSEFDLLNFDDALFPSTVLNFGTTVCGHQKVQFQYRSILKDAATPFHKMVEMFRSSEARQKPLQNWFETKLYLQSMLLLPALYLQALGSPVYKRDSFPMVKPFVPETIWAIVQKGSDVRNWGFKQNRLVNLLSKVLISMPSPWLLEVFSRRLVKHMPPHVGQILGKRWRAEILDFANYLANSLAKKDILV